MSATEDEEIDQAWDSLPPPPVSAVAVSSGTPSLLPGTEEVDSGWDDVPEALEQSFHERAGVSQPSGGKRRPHRQRRSKTNAVVSSANPLLLPRPAEPTKKQHREQARKARAHEAQVKQRNKEQRKAERAAEAREQTAARLRQTAAEEQARQMRREARARAESERPPAQSSDEAAKVARKAAKKAQAAAAPTQRKARADSDSPKSERAKKSGVHPGVIIALLVAAAAVAAFLLRK